MGVNKRLSLACRHVSDLIERITKYAARVIGDHLRKAARVSPADTGRGIWER